MDFHEQELNQELEWMRKQFEPLGGEIKRPKSLDAHALFDKLDALEPDADDQQAAGQVVKLKRPAWMRSALSMAACLAVVVGAVVLQRGLNKSDISEFSLTKDSRGISPIAEEPELYSAENAALLNGEVTQAADYTQIRDAVNAMSADPYREYGWDSAVDMAAPEAAADEEQPPTGGGSPDNGYSSTNVQETGVDEADIVKTDGRYIYSLVRQNTTTSSPTIFITDSTTMKVSAKIVLDKGNVSEFYLSGNQLVVVGHGSYESILPSLPETTIIEQTNADLVEETVEMVEHDRAYFDGMNQTVYSEVYDISNLAQPVKVREFTQDGFCQSSRMIDGTLYLVSERYISPNLRSKAEPLYNLIPFTYDGKQAEFVSADEIVLAPQGYSPSYAVVSAVDVKTGKSSTRAVLGGSIEGIYMSLDNCYVYFHASNARELSEGDAYEQTGIIRFSAKGTDIAYTGTVKVDGWIDGQFSLSEQGGNLRVVTTASYVGKAQSNNLFVYDKNLQQIGQLVDLAPDEQVYSVRYVGNMAYVVTFRQVDPLFAIDLSDPKNPKQVGQLKIPGFSEYLHPLDEHTLLGVGQNADTEGNIRGLKLSLFDVSDPASPKETGVYNFGHAGSYSEVLYNHKAIMFHDEKQLFAFPASLTAKDYDFARDFYMVFTYDKNTGFTLVKAISADETEEYLSYQTVHRGLYIGNTFYTFSDEEIVSYDLDTLEVKERVALK